MFITVEKKQDPKETSKEGIEKAKKGQKDLRTILLSKASTSSSGSSTKPGPSNKDVANGLITENEFKELFPEGYCSTTLFTKPQEYWAMNKETIKDLATSEGIELKLTKWLEWQRPHSRDTEILSELLQYSNAKRFEMPPSTQNPCYGSQELQSQPAMFTSPAKSKQGAIFTSPEKSIQPSIFMSPPKLKQPLVFTSPARSKQPNKKKQKIPLTKPFDKKNGDIRAFFSPTTKSTKSHTKPTNDLGLQNDLSVPTRLFSLLVDLSLDITNAPKNCYVCQSICECTLLQSVKEDKKLPIVFLEVETIKEPKLPDINLIDDFDAESILKCVKSKLGENKHNAGVNHFNLEMDMGEIKETESTIKDEVIEGDNVLKNEELKKAKETLGFFGLDSIDDIFADDDIDNTQKKVVENKNTQNDKISRSPSTEYPLIPSILSGRIITVPTSPILCSQPRKFQLSIKKDRPHCSTPKLNSCRKQLIKELTNNNNLVVVPSIKPETSMRNSRIDTTNNKSLMTITQLVGMINKTDGNALDSKSVYDRVQPEEERSVSPMFLRRAEKRKYSVNTNTVDISIASTSQNSLIMLDSDSDSDSTQIYDPAEFNNIANNKNKSLNKTNVSPGSGKRKRDLDNSFVKTTSPYFNKKQKLDNETEKQMSLQEK